VDGGGRVGISPLVRDISLVGAGGAFWRGREGSSRFEEALNRTRSRGSSVLFVATSTGAFLGQLLSKSSATYWADLGGGASTGGGAVGRCIPSPKSITSSSSSSS
jgi:hypothetical protein